jgi:hypothetical protein
MAGAAGGGEAKAKTRLLGRAGAGRVVRAGVGEKDGEGQQRRG